jgi:uncharacterized membrane protein YhhN
LRPEIEDLFEIADCSSWKEASLVVGYWALVISLALALLDWLAVVRRQKRLEYIFKPATLVAVLIGAWLLTRGPHDAWVARCFLLGLAFSLAGDVLLMLPGKRFFLPGLVAFLLAHLCYVAGLNQTLPPWPALVPLAAVAAVGLTLYRGIAAGLRRHGQTGLLVPVAIYSLGLSLMLLSAWATLFRPEWTPLRRGLVIIGASLFFASDTMLAWDRFVTPSPSAGLLVMVTYHLAQVALAASIALKG